ncbi:hypothetical protein WKI65_43510 [Streptomyces sp. MS1.AVA.3]|uniref:hypothetical protein n=1 Tax=Streptomyces decoyicus TaxID=249567 RepID=UPI0030C59018
MSDQPADVPTPFEQEIRASVTVSGTRAALLRDLASVLGRTPESLAVEWAAGSLVIPTAPIGESFGPEDWGLFDGPEDLAGRADEYLREGLGE